MLKKARVIGRTTIVKARGGVACPVMVMAVVVVAALSAVFPVVAPPAYGKDLSAGSGQGSDGSAQISVSVSYESAASSSGGDGGGVVTSSQTVTATVLPTCYYQPMQSGKELAEDARGEYKSLFNDENGGTVDTRYPGWQDHADDAEGHWYVPTCSSARLQPGEHIDQVAEEYFKDHLPVFVPAGGQAPAALIDGGTLAKAAWDAVTIPQPGVETNPKLGDSGATLVGIDTWVWATEDTPAKVTATATAGPVTATVTAVSDGLRLSAPDSVPDCHGFGTAWTEGAAEGSSNCTIEFTRSSAHLGGTTPLDISVGYSVSYTATDGATGDLDPVTTTSTTNIPVAEVQTINN